MANAIRSACGRRRPPGLSDTSAGRAGNAEHAGRGDGVRRCDSPSIRPAHFADAAGRVHASGSDNHPGTGVRTVPTGRGRSFQIAAHASRLDEAQPAEFQTCTSDDAPVAGRLTVAGTRPVVNVQGRIAVRVVS